jgi:8-oxo-dGTP pyrophosphatase MutT (NUDIX family)
MALIQYEAAGGVVISDQKMLLLERVSRGEIRLPKGHIEPGETPDVTALREVAEETGVADLEIVADLGVHLVEFDYKGDHYRRTESYYLMRQVGDGQATRPAKDVEDFRPLWVALDQAADHLTFPTEQAVARRAILVYADTPAAGKP